MTLNQIKYAVEKGRSVHWANNGYSVIKGCGMDMGFALVDQVNHWFSPSKKFRQEWI